MCLMSKRIKECRLNNHLTQEDLANKLGLKKSAIAKYENGRVENIKRNTIEEMAKIFIVMPSYIMGWSDLPNGNTLGSELKKIIAEVSKETNIPYLEIIQIIFNPDLNIPEGCNILNKDNILKLINNHNSSLNKVDTLAAHFDGDDFTEDELEEIRQFAEFVKKRNSNK